MEFQDPLAKRSKAKRDPKSRFKVFADSPSHSLSMASRDQNLSRNLNCEILANNYLIIDTSEIINDQKIRLSKTAALALAHWIVKAYANCNCGAGDITSARYNHPHLLWCKHLKSEGTNAENSKEADMARESSSDSGIPPNKTETE